MEDVERSDGKEKYKIEYCNEIFVSEFDLEHPICKKVIEIGQSSGELPLDLSIEDVLYHVWGINVALGYTQDVVEHITRLKERKTGVRYSGYERSDVEWINHPMCSKVMRNKWESIVASKNWERW